MENALVECDCNFDPPLVRITLPGLTPFNVSWGVYEYLRDNFGLPSIICDC